MPSSAILARAGIQTRDRLAAISILPLGFGMQLINKLIFPRELDDCAMPCIAGVVATDSVEEAFKWVDFRSSMLSLNKLDATDIDIDINDKIWKKNAQSLT